MATDRGETCLRGSIAYCPRSDDLRHTPRLLFFGSSEEEKNEYYVVHTRELTSGVPQETELTVRPRLQHMM